MKLSKSDLKKVRKAMEWLCNEENEYVTNPGGQTLSVILNRCIIELTFECSPEWYCPTDESRCVGRFEYKAYNEGKNDIAIQNLDVKEFLDAYYTYNNE